jgi:hypothetical protein
MDLTQRSHIKDLTPEFILALAVTAPYLQAPALRDAICKHVSFRPSVRVNVPVSRLVRPFQCTKPDKTL